LPGFQFISAAFDNTPGTPIIAGAIPEPGTLALLAFGAAGVAAIHRRRKQPKAV
jgi:PEP-CTERM motif